MNKTQSFVIAAGLLKAASWIVGIIAAAFFIILLTTLSGMLVGWVVGLWFTDTILNVVAAFGVDTSNMALWQLGGTLGFVGSFFKTYGSTKTTTTNNS